MQETERGLIQKRICQLWSFDEWLFPLQHLLSELPKVTHLDSCQQQSDVSSKSRSFF
jgi:hypothetical protein